MIAIAEGGDTRRSARRGCRRDRADGWNGHVTKDIESERVRCSGCVARWPYHGGRGADCIGGSPPADGRTAGNGSLMRTRRWPSPTSVTDAIVEAARAIRADPLHPDAGDACVRGAAQRHAVLTGEPMCESGCDIASDRRDL
jgi:hypothetical protein